MRVVAFGEIMGRMCMPGVLKFRQGLPGAVDMTFAGAEANVAASIVMLGGEACYVTTLPQNDLADCIIRVLRGLGIDTSHIKRSSKGRLGLYFVETGANQRPSKVIYDRDYSSISLAEGTDFNWSEIFKDATWFHISGITPGLSSIAAETSLFSVKKAKECGIPVSLDLNFRNKLWNYGDGLTPRELCRKIMARILPYVDVVIGNEEDADDVLGIKAGETDVYRGELDVSRYPDVARQICSMYPNVDKVAITLRESISASHNNWGAMLYEKGGDTVSFAPLKDNTYTPYEIKNIVDRIGGGDAFSAGLIFALQDEGVNHDNQSIINFAVASSCLCHSIYGDFNYTTKAEVMALAGGDSSGRVKR